MYMEKARLEELLKDRAMWLQGQYFMKAIAQNFSEKKVYPHEPFLVSHKKEKEKTIEEKNIELYNRLNNWAAGVKARLKNAP